MRNAIRRLALASVLGGAFVLGGLAAPALADPIVIGNGAGSGTLHVGIPGVSTSGASTSVFPVFPAFPGCGDSTGAGDSNASTSGVCVRVP